ncbi:DUF1648 domain-containing protein [Ornithinibacillus massiliensis]|uniref:DUF1648 domain-containing protein n=1 Tax=Ornithinibacillus massiliensis TaxID=1944633 RepID=A0ABS5MF80_9BACI|nr:DUF5808 domain-containing protein [Ornithinibacillus massiliensis]MBS3680978.1 DUF1648 domain-containing protein [Ornithinibacillus massiliensis]
MNMIYLFLILLPVFILTMFIPYWTRKTESFGVSIPEDIYHSDNIKKLRKQYVQFSGIASILVVVLFLVLSFIDNLDEITFALSFSLLIFLYLIGTFFIYLHFHRAMKRLKQLENWGQEKAQAIFVSTDFRSHKLIHSNAWFIISFLITFAMITITFMFYDRIPEQIPIQYNMSGEVTNWEDKSTRILLAMPIMSLYLTLLFMFLNTMIAKAKQQISAEKPEESLQQNIIFRRRWSMYLIVTGIGLTLLFAFIQFSFIFSVNPAILTISPLVFTAILTLWAIILAITTGQGGSRIKVSTGTNGEVINRDDDSNWKLGIFYFNTNDPALFLEKRFGIGWTINWARPLAWSIMLGIILLAVGIPLLLGM